MADSREEALRAMDAMFARTKGNGPLDQIPLEGMVHDFVNKLDALPLSEVQPLMARYLFERHALPKRARDYVSSAFDAWARRVAEALGVTEREVIAAAIGGKLPLVGPHPIAGHTYLGVFRTDGAVTVSDPCYRDERGASRAILATHLDVRPGPWHAYVLPHTEIERTAALIAIHEEGFTATAAEAVGVLGVDSGAMGIFDETFPKRRDDDSIFPEAVIDRRAVVTRSGLGDGGYTLYVGRNRSDEIVKIRVPFIGSVVPVEIDSTITQTATAARAYSPKEHFSVGDTITHPKFGTGTVVAVEGTKIDVAFADEDERRRLVHKA